MTKLNLIKKAVKSIWAAAAMLPDDFFLPLKTGEKLLRFQGL